MSGTFAIFLHSYRNLPCHLKCSADMTLTDTQGIIKRSQTTKEIPYLMDMKYGILFQRFRENHEKENI